MAPSQPPTTIKNLPGDILSDIFVRLRARQLAQMRCVSKSWYFLLSQSSFVKSHLHRSIYDNDNGILLVFQKDFSFDRRPCTAHPSRSSLLELYNSIRLPVTHYGESTGNLIGSVNGLICFNFGPDDDYAYYIWNPSLSAVLTLPPSSFPSRWTDIVNFSPRFGFDPKNNDYKVVKVHKVESTSVNNKVEVYSMRKGSWKLIPQSFPSHISCMDWQSEVCVDGYDGYVHWLGNVDEQRNIETIVAFDLDAEIFREIPLPKSLLGLKFGCSPFLGVMGGKLCVMAKKDTKYELWVMDEYGVAESWVKHHLFSKIHSYDMTPYGFTLRNEFLFDNRHDCYGEVDDEDDHDRSSLYDPVGTETKMFDICTGPFIIDKLVEYVDSLVWIAPDKDETSCCSGISQLQI